MTPVDWVIVAAIIGLILLPPSFDPAVRLREWLERRRKRQ